MIVVENIQTMEVKKYYTEDDTISIPRLIPSNAYKLTIMMKSATGKLGMPTYFLVTTAADPPSEFVALKTTHEAVKSGFKVFFSNRLLILQSIYTI